MEKMTPQKKSDYTPEAFISSNTSFRDSIELLQELQDAFLACANHCEKRIAYISEYEPDIASLTIPHGFSIKLEKTISNIENLLFSYHEHLRLNPYEVWDYILANEDLSSSHYGLTIQEDIVTIHIPYLDMPQRKKGGTSMVERGLSSLIKKNIKNFPRWYSWQAKFFFVFPASTSAKPRDVDNYDYKKVIDLIAFALGSSDNAIHFAMSSETIFTDKIASGVYIEITPRSLENAPLPNWQKRGRGRPKGSKDKKKRKLCTASRTPSSKQKFTLANH